MIFITVFHACRGQTHQNSKAILYTVLVGVEADGRYITKILTVRENGPIRQQILNIDILLPALSLSDCINNNEKIPISKTVREKTKS